MFNVELSWHEAAVASVCLFAGAIFARRASRPLLASSAGVARETATLLALFALWQFAGSFSVMSTDEAVGRASWLWHAERVLHMPSEAAIQRAFLPHPLLVQICNLYYAILHFPVLIACLVWLFARYRRQYRHVRATVVIFTASALLMQLIPVAPPRMLPSDGMVDTALQYGQSVYGSVGGFDADQLSAMPSVHVGWALLVAVVVVHVSRSRLRWLALAYPVLTTLAVVATANHFWLDGVVAGVLLAATLVVQRAARVIHRRVARPRATVAGPLPATPAGLNGQQPAALAGAGGQGQASRDRRGLATQDGRVLVNLNGEHPAAPDGQHPSGADGRQRAAVDGREAPGP